MYIFTVSCKKNNFVHGTINKKVNNRKMKKIIKRQPILQRNIEQEREVCRKGKEIFLFQIPSPKKIFCMGF